MNDRTNDRPAERTPPAPPEQTDRTTGPPAIGASWLTYAQIAERFGMSAEAARQRARRTRWRTLPGNDGRTLVLVPDGTDVQPRVRPPDQTAVQTPAQTAEIARLSHLIERANERADRADARADAADADRRATEARADGERTEWREERTRLVVEVDGLRAERDREKAGREGERSRADVLRDRIDTMQAQIATAAAVAEAMQAERDQARREAQEAAAWRARNLLGRLRTAWRGE